MATTHTLLMKTKTVTEDDARGANKSATTVLATAEAARDGRARGELARVIADTLSLRG